MFTGSSPAPISTGFSPPGPMSTGSSISEPSSDPDPMFTGSSPAPISTGFSPPGPMSTGSSPSCTASHCACEYMESPKQNCNPSSEPFLSYTQGLLQRRGREPYGSLPTFLYTPSILGSMLPQ